MNDSNKTSEQLIKNLQNSWKKVYIWKVINLSLGNKIHIKPREVHEVTVGKNGCSYIVAEGIK